MRKLATGIVATLALLTSPGAAAADVIAPRGPYEATLLAEPGGTPATFSCSGDPGLYGVSVSRSDELGVDGRLAKPLAVGAAALDSPGLCISRLPSASPGEFYWQPWRRCSGCPAGYESGIVARFRLVSADHPELLLPERVYGGYPFLANVGSELSEGSEMRIERRRAGRWVPVARGAFAVAEGAFDLDLPRGTQRLRAAVVAGGRTFYSPPVRRTVLGSGGTLTRVTAGRYEGTAGRATRRAGFTVRGRSLRDIQVQVTLRCHAEDDPFQHTFEIVTARVREARVAPDGTFLGVEHPDDRTTVRVSGHMAGRQVGDAHVTIAVGPRCSGQTQFHVHRTG